MHFVIKNNINKEGQYLSGEIVGDTTGDISRATSLMEKIIIDFVKDEFGKQHSDSCKIIDVHSLDQVAEPLIDGIRLYRIDTEPQRINVYQRISKQVSGYVYGQMVQTEFYRINIFDILSYKNIISPPPAPIPEMVKLGSANIEYPKEMTLSPICDLIEALKSSPKFLKLKAVND